MNRFKYSSLKYMLTDIQSLKFEKNSILLIEGYIPHEWFYELIRGLNKHRKEIEIDYPMVHQPYDSEGTFISITYLNRLKSMRDSLSEQIKLIKE